MHLSSRTPSWSYQRDWLWLWCGLGLLGLHLWRSMLIVTREIVQFRLLQHGEDAWFCNLVHLVKCCYNTLKEVGVPQDMDNTEQINQMLAMQELHPLAGPLPPWWDWDYLDCIYGDPGFMSDTVTQDIVKFHPPQPYMYIINYRAENVHRW